MCAQSAGDKLHLTLLGCCRDNDGIVQRNEFTDLSLPHGFRAFYEEETRSPGPIASPDPVRQRDNRPMLAFWTTSSDGEVETDPEFKYHKNINHETMAQEFGEAHEETEIAFMDEEMVMKRKLDTMETTIDVLLAELKATQGCVQAVMNHFSVKPAEGISGQDFEAKKRRRHDTISALRKKLLLKEERIRKLEGQVAAAHAHA